MGLFAVTAVLFCNIKKSTFQTLHYRFFRWITNDFLGLAEILPEILDTRDPGCEYRQRFRTRRGRKMAWICVKQAPYIVDDVVFDEFRTREIKDRYGVDTCV